MSITPLMPVYPRCGVRPVKGEHCHLIDEDGTRYLDFASGIAVNLLGHSHAGLIGAIQRQAETLMHVSNLYGSPQGEELAQMLVDNSFADTVFFTNSGAEAVEAAIKTARAYHQHDGGDAKRTELITFTNAFHGRTMATISASNQEKMHKGFMPLLGGFQYAEFDDLDHAKSLMSEKTAGFLVEPIQGEGGIRPGSEEFIRGLRQLADENDLMLVFDEVQCGVARTGKLYAYEHYGIEPDIMATAKGIGGGFPLGAVLATEKAASGMGLGTHGSTYGGNPLGCAVGCAVMEAVTEPGFLDEVNRKGGFLRQRLEGLVADHPEVFAEVRGQGLMMGLRCVATNSDVVKAGYDNMVITVPAAENVIRILPPLTITEEEIAEAVNRLDAAARQLKAA